MACAGANETAFFAQLITTIFNKIPDSISMPPMKSYDFIIVGGGAAGCVVANRLSAVTDWTVLLLEVGGEEPYLASVPILSNYSLDTRLDWSILADSNPSVCGGKQCKMNDGKVLGGSTVIKPEPYNRGNKYIYNLWKALGNENWSYEDVLPYFKKSENNLNSTYANNTKYHGVGGEQCVEDYPYKDDNVNLFLKAFRELGFSEVDVNGESQLGCMLQQTYTCKGVRQSAYSAYVKPTRFQRQNFQIITNAIVTKVLFDPMTKRATGVEYIDEKNDTKKVYAKKEVILCAGVFGSPKILQLSGVGPAELLTNLSIPLIMDLKVGDKFCDHLSVNYHIDLDKSSPFANTTLVNLTQALADSFQYQNGSLYTLGVNNIICYATSETNINSAIPDLQFFLNYETRNSLYDVVRIGFYFHLPKKCGKVMIKSKDPFEPPAITDAYKIEEEDLNALADGMVIISKLTKTKALEGIKLYPAEVPQCDGLDNSTTEYFKCVLSSLDIVSPALHGMGTCKMGPKSDINAVVDPQLRVRGTIGLRVIDASIGPVLPNAQTPTATTMIAEKGVDMVLKEWLEKNIIPNVVVGIGAHI